MALFEAPKRSIHRGFLYIDDEVVINSLSAFESGKIDEVVAKVNSAREGGAGGGLSAFGAKVEGGGKRNSALEEEMVRTRTRFSVFELWYQSLAEQKALGKFNGWGPNVLADLSIGQTVELRAILEAAPLQNLMRLFLWFADKAKAQGHVFSQKGEELKQTKESERNMRLLLGNNSESVDEVIILATPVGDPGPRVAMPVKTDWLIGPLGRLGGEYTVIGQVDRIINDAEEFPAIRLTTDVAPTPLEVNVIKDVVGNFTGPAKELGIDLTENEAVIRGPALWLDPIAIYR